MARFDLELPCCSGQHRSKPRSQTGFRSPENIFGQSFRSGFGGKGANQASPPVYAGRMYFMVARVAAICSAQQLSRTSKVGIDTSHVKQVKGLSSWGCAHLPIEPDGQNRILVVKGANDALNPPSGCGGRYVEATDCIVLQFEIPLATGLLHHRIRAKTTEFDAF